ncbi:MAG: glycosyltransferase family A protein, partial [Dehalococcoidales bacterium]|nr:glycosyltransferase family A protein [Dehalococcoidales bacterium]
MFGSLSKQTYKNFELILVDTLYDKRHKEVTEYADELGIDVYHVRPNRDPNDHGFIAEARNNALPYSSGEYFMLCDDYYWLEPQVLEKHILFQRRYGRKTITGGAIMSYYSYPVKDEKGLITTFGERKEERFPDSLIDERYHNTIDELFKAYNKGGEDIAVLIGGFYGIPIVNANFVVSMEEMEAANGFDERLIGHGYDDTDLLTRLNMNGNKLFIIDNA